MQNRKNVAEDDPNDDSVQLLNASLLLIKKEDYIESEESITIEQTKVSSSSHFFKNNQELSTKLKLPLNIPQLQSQQENDPPLSSTRQRINRKISQLDLSSRSQSITNQTQRSYASSISR